jgi:hypothetical protein
MPRLGQGLLFTSSNENLLPTHLHCLILVLLAFPWTLVRREISVLFLNDSSRGFCKIGRVPHPRLTRGGARECLHLPSRQGSSKGWDNAKNHLSLIMLRKFGSWVSGVVGLVIYPPKFLMTGTGSLGVCKHCDGVSQNAVSLSENS